MQESNRINSREMDNRYPVIPSAFRSQLTPNLLEAIQPYQAFYNSVMLQLEQVLAVQRMGASNTQQVNTLTEMAERTRREAEAAVGISRERMGRIQEYPMAPNEVFSTQYITGVDPIRHGHQADSEGVFSVQHRRQDGTWEQVFNEREAAQQQGESLHRRIEAMFYEQARPRERRTVIYVSEEGRRQWEEATRQWAEDFERQLWFGSSTPKKTRRDKKVVVSTSIYWEYQPFD